MPVGKIICLIKVMSSKEKWVLGCPQDSGNASPENPQYLRSWQYGNSKDCMEKGYRGIESVIWRKDNKYDGTLTGKDKTLAIARDKHDKGQVPQCIWVADWSASLPLYTAAAASIVSRCRRAFLFHAQLLSPIPKNTHYRQSEIIRQIPWAAQ